MAGMTSLCQTLFQNQVLEIYDQQREVCVKLYCSLTEFWSKPFKEIQDHEVPAPHLHMKPRSDLMHTPESWFEHANKVADDIRAKYGAYA